MHVLLFRSFMRVGIWMIWIRFVYKARWRDSIVISAAAEFFYICAEHMTGFITSQNYERIRQEQGEQRTYFTIKMMDVVRHIPIDEIVFLKQQTKHTVFYFMG